MAFGGAAAIADAVALLAGVIRNTRELVRAVQDGRAFLQKHHPDAGPLFAELLSQMSLTLVGLAEVTKVVTAFRFVASDTGADRELARFNDYVVERKAKVAELRRNIRRLKGSSGKVVALSEKLDAQADSPGWGSMFGLLGDKARRRSAELADALQTFYGADERLVEAIEQMLAIDEAALADVEDALGPAGMYRPEGVTIAAARLHTYAAAFREPQAELDELVEEIGDQVDALKPQ
jgi:hypothetical protein